MSVIITSYVPTYAGGSPSTGTIRLYAPNSVASISVSQVNGLQELLDAKLDDTLMQLGNTNVSALGADVNLLEGMFLYGLTTADLEKLADVNASATEVNYLIGTTSAIQTQLNNKPSISSITATRDIFIGTGSGTIAVESFPTVLGAYDLNDLDTPTSSVSMGGQIIQDVADPVDGTDAANRQWVLDVIGGAGSFLPVDGSGEMTGNLDLNGNDIILDADGNSYFDVSNNILDLYLNGVLAFNFGTTLNVNGRVINGVSTPLVGTDAANKTYVDSNYLALAGGVMSGSIDLNGNDLILTANGQTRIEGDTDGEFTIVVANSDAMLINSSIVNVFSRTVTGAADPVNPQDLVTLNYAEANFAALDGSAIMSGDLNMGGNTITNIGDPVTGADVGDRDYNDARYARRANNLSDLTNVAAARSNLALATVAATGSFNDLLDAPVIVANLNDLGDVAIGSPGAGQNGYVLTWVNGSSEFQLLVPPVLSIFGRTGSVVAANGDYTATQITNTPSGSISATTVQAAIDELATEKLNLSGGTMGGTLNMNGNSITNIGSMTITNHSFASTVYSSSLGGNSFYIRTTNSPTASTPTYSFAADTDSGMWWNGSGISISINGTNKLTVGASATDFNGNRGANVAAPTADGDAVNLGHLRTMGVQQVLGSLTDVDLTSGLGGSTEIYTVPTGRQHIITQIIVIATSYDPGMGPVDPVISIGSAGPDFDNILGSEVLSWGPSGAADQALYLSPDQGASTPNAADVVSIQVDTLAGGTFNALVADIYIIGFEL